MLSDIPKLMEERNIDSLIVLGNKLYPDDPFWRYVLGGVQLDEGIFIWNRGQKPILVASEEFSGSAVKKATLATGAEFVPYSNFVHTWEKFKKEEKDNLIRYAKYYACLFNQLGVGSKVSIYGAIDASGEYHLMRKIEKFMKSQNPNFEIVPGAWKYGCSIISHARMTKDGREMELIRRLGEKSNEVVTSVIDWLRNKKLIAGKVYDNGNPVTIGMLKIK